MNDVIAPYFSPPRVNAAWEWFIADVDKYPRSKFQLHGHFMWLLQ